MKTYILIAITFLLLFSGCDRRSYIEKALILAQDTNTNLPMMLDESVRWDYVKVTVDKIYQFNYTLMKTDKNNFNKTSFIKHKKIEVLRGINEMKKSSGFDFFREYKVIFEYKYKDIHGDLLVSFQVRPDEYN
jgi:hypothetical protein